MVYRAATAGKSDKVNKICLAQIRRGHNLSSLVEIRLKVGANLGEDQSPCQHAHRRDCVSQPTLDFQIWGGE